MTNGRKQRGMATQALIAADLRETGLFPYATDTGAGRSGKDILNTEDVAIEVKARANFDPLAYMRQAKSNATEDEISFAVMRLNGQGPASIDDWAVIMPWGEMKRLIKYMQKCHKKGVRFRR